MITGTTSSGFEFTASENIQKDFRFVKYFAAAQSEKTPAADKVDATVKLVSLVLGEQEEAFIQHIADQNDGVADVDQVGYELGEIIRISSEKSETVKK